MRALGCIILAVLIAALACAAQPDRSSIYEYIRAAEEIRGKVVVFVERVRKLLVNVSDDLPLRVAGQVWNRYTDALIHLMSADLSLSQAKMHYSTGDYPKAVECAKRAVSYYVRTIEDLRDGVLLALYESNVTLAAVEFREVGPGEVPPPSELPGFIEVTNSTVVVVSERRGERNAYVRIVIRS